MAGQLHCVAGWLECADGITAGCCTMARSDRQGITTALCWGRTGTGATYCNVCGSVARSDRQISYSMVGTVARSGNQNTVRHDGYGG